MTGCVRYPLALIPPTIGYPDQEEEGPDQEGHGAIFADGR
jgi:hypothetical protein